MPPSKRGGEGEFRASHFAFSYTELYSKKRLKRAAFVNVYLLIPGFSINELTVHCHELKLRLMNSRFAPCIPLAVSCVIRCVRPTNSKFHPRSGFIPTEADLIKKEAESLT